MQVRVARIFNTFGPRMHPNDGRVVSNFIIQAIQGKDITIYGERRWPKCGTRLLSRLFVCSREKRGTLNSGRPRPLDAWDTLLGRNGKWRNCCFKPTWRGSHCTAENGSISERFIGIYEVCTHTYIHTYIQ